MPFDWLQTAIGAEHLTSTGVTDTYWLTANAQVRLTGNIRLDFQTRVYATTDSRPYSFEVQVKTQ